LPNLPRGPVRLSSQSASLAAPANSIRFGQRAPCGGAVSGYGYNGSPGFRKPSAACRPKDCHPEDTRITIRAFSENPRGFPPGAQLHRSRTSPLAREPVQIIVIQRPFVPSLLYAVVSVTSWIDDDGCFDRLTGSDIQGWGCGIKKGGYPKVSPLSYPARPVSQALVAAAALAATSSSMAVVTDLGRSIA